MSIEYPFTITDVTHDLETELPNLHLFQDRLWMAKRLADRHDYPFAMFLVSFDNFDQVAKQLPAEQVSPQLVLLVKRLVQVVRETDTVARLAENQYAILLTQLSKPNDAEKVAQTVLDLVSMPLVVADEHYTVTASLGGVVYPDTSQDCTALLEKAKTNLATATAEGGNKANLDI